MNNLFRQTSSLAAVTIAAVFFFHSASSAQIKRIGQASDFWTVEYTLTIQGKGEQEPELGSGGPVKSWKVNRVYEGKARLGPGVRVADTKWNDAERKESIWTERKIRYRDSQPKLHIKIFDYVDKIFDPQCEENSTEFESWSTDVQGTVPKGDEVWLSIDNKLQTHDVVFPVMYMPKGTAYDLRHEVQVKYNPQKPGRMNPPPRIEQLSLANHRIPDVYGWLERNGEITIDGSRLVEENGEFRVTSPAFLLDESLLPGVDTRGKVTLQIIYVFKKAVE